MGLEIRKALVEGPLHEDLLVKDEAVEDQEFDHGGAVRVSVFDEFAIEDGVGVEAFEGLVFVVREVQQGHPPVVVLAIDEVVDFAAIFIGGAVEETSNAVGLLAKIVA